MTTDLIRAKTIRAKLTDSEWLRIRKLALDRKMSVEDLAGSALRDLLKEAKA